MKSKWMYFAAGVLVSGIAFAILLSVLHIRMEDSYESQLDAKQEEIHELQHEIDPQHRRFGHH